MFGVSYCDSCRSCFCHYSCRLGCWKVMCLYELSTYLHDYPLCNITHENRSTSYGFSQKKHCFTDERVGRYAPSVAHSAVQRKKDVCHDFQKCDIGLFSFARQQWGIHNFLEDESHLEGPLRHINDPLGEDLPEPRGGSRGPISDLLERREDPLEPEKGPLGPRKGSLAPRTSGPLRPRDGP